MSLEYQLRLVRNVIDFWFSEWSSSKGARWERLTGDSVFSPKTVANLCTNLLSGDRVATKRVEDTLYQAAPIKPTRRITLANGMFTVSVQPPAHLGLPEKSVDLTLAQAKRFVTWEAGEDKRNIQDVFPELTAYEREILLNGVG